MKYVWWALGLLTVGVLAREGYLAFVARRRRQAELFKLAEERAAATGKPLIVIGDPNAGVLVRLLGPTYKCGSLCIGERGCPSCERQISGNIEQILPSLAPNSAVVFVGQGIERVRDLALVGHHLDRVSGGDLFIAHLESASLAAWFTPGHRQRVLFAPPSSLDIVYKPLPWSDSPRRGEVHVVELPALRQRFSAGASTETAVPVGRQAGVWDGNFGGPVIDVSFEP